PEPWCYAGAMRPLHFICAVAAAWALTVPSAISAERSRGVAQRGLLESGASNLTIFVRGVPIGNEQVEVTRTADGWTVFSTGRLGAPLDAIARRVEIRYTADWRPREFTADLSARGSQQSVHTIVDGTQARTNAEIAGQHIEKTDTVHPSAAIVLPNT